LAARGQAQEFLNPNPYPIPIVTKTPRAPWQLAALTRLAVELTADKSAHAQIRQEIVDEQLKAIAGGIGFFNFKGND
jgi:hypothetical protein